MYECVHVAIDHFIYYSIEMSLIHMHLLLTACESRDLGVVDSETNSRCVTSSSVSITNGVGCYSSVAVGSLVIYQCDEGYSMSGDFQRTCQTNGSWSGSIPLCIG